MQKAVLIRETFTIQDNLYSDSPNSAKAPALCHRPPLYSWREELLPPPWRQNTAKYKLNLQSTSTVKRSNKQQSTINSNHQLSCPHKLEKFYTITNTSLKVYQNVSFTLETLCTKTTGKVSDVWVYQLMTFHFICCTETLWTFTTNIRLHTFVSPYVYLKFTTVAEFLLTNVTSEPSAFIVWLQ